MLRFDVVVVGAGPAGSLAARAAAQAGAEVLLLERAPRREARCAGLVSLSTQERLAVPENLVLRRILGVKVFGPDGLVLELRAENPKAVVLDRTGLDRWLRKEAEGRGVHVWPCAAQEVGPDFVRCGKERVTFAVLIGADGARSAVGQAFGFPGPGEELVGVQAVVEADLRDEVHVFLGPVPDFFGWAVPAEEGLTRVGLATSRGRTALARLRDLLEDRFPRARVRQIQTGLIPLGPPSRTVQGRTLLVGNAAAQVKPLTGGGLAFISLCAPLAGKIAAQGPERLQGYEQAWREAIGEEIAFQLKGRAAFLRLGPAKIAEALKHMPPRLANFLAQEGEIDSFSSLPCKLRRQPDLWPSLLALLRWLPAELWG
ncbi:MAG: geranylgeranyl reductase family protein [Candidatus Bipolaricaulaceae bacterium]